MVFVKAGEALSLNILLSHNPLSQEELTFLVQTSFFETTPYTLIKGTIYLNNLAPLFEIKIHFAISEPVLT